MRLFTLTTMEKSEEFVKQLVSKIQKELQTLHIADAVIVTDKHFASYTTIIADGVMPQFGLVEMAEPVYRAAGEAIADMLVREKEQVLLRQLIQKDFVEYDDTDVSKIMSYCNQFLQGDEQDPYYRPDKSLSRRKQSIADEVFQYLQLHTDLNLEGFMRFRLFDYFEELREVVEYAVDEFLMDKQYQEFISLLKYFVYIQEAKTPSAHLIHKGGTEFSILNDVFEPIDTSQFDSSFTVEMLDKDINFEDMIVSTLITVSPQQIYIHTREPDVQIIGTIKQIFEDRVSVCSHCLLCNASLGEKVK